MRCDPPPVKYGPVLAGRAPPGHSSMAREPLREPADQGRMRRAILAIPVVGAAFLAPAAALASPSVGAPSTHGPDAAAVAAGAEAPVLPVHAKPRAAKLVPS